MSSRPALLWRGVHRHLRRPADLVEQTRQLFYVLALVPLVVVTPGAAVQAGGGWSRAAVLTAGATLAISWTHRYVTGVPRSALDLADVVAITVFALAAPGPEWVFGVLFPGMYLRAVYGRTTHVAAYAVAMCAGMTLAALAWPGLPGRTEVNDPAIVFMTLPIVGLTVIGARHLAVALLAREATRERDAVLVALGGELLGVTDPVEIRQRVWAAVEAVCASTPGLRALLVGDGDAAGRPVVARSGGFVHDVAVLPPAALAPVAGGDGLEVADTAPLDAATGSEADWVVLPALSAHRHVLLAGAPGGVPTEVLTALRSVGTLAALALRAGDERRDLEVRARTDALTGLANRGAFAAALDDAAASGTTDVWVLFADLDDFKTVNDALGHAVGDLLLQHVAARVAGTMREQDVCARLGGDEFAVLVRGATEAEARAIAERLVERLSAPVRLDGRLVQVGASVGLAPLVPGVSGDEAVQRADLAMYAAKSSGKNRVRTFSPALRDAVGGRTLVGELRRAVDEEQFVVHYQPIVAVADGRCTAVEALVRWAHPTRGLLFPAAFLEAAEDSGLIVAIGESVLRRACADAAGWSDDRPVALHVNVAPAQLADPRFPAVVRACLRESGLAPARLVVEITESTALDLGAVQSALDALTGLGVRLAVDDFGTGYSALTTLRTLPVDVVKIDRSFVAGAGTEVVDRAVLEAVVQMAGRLGLETVAEGVEDPAQQEFVARVGVTTVQGYLHSRPVPCTELAAWLADPARRPAGADLTAGPAVSLTPA